MIPGGLTRFYLFILCFTTIALLGCEKSPRVVWRFQTGAKISHTPAISGDKLIVASNDKNVYALELKTGKQIWKRDLGSGIFAAPLVQKNTIFVGTETGEFFGLDGRTGQILWKFRAGALVDFVSCSDTEGVYFGSYDNYFYKISYDGKLIWKLKTGMYVTGSCMTGKDMVFTASWDTNVYGIRQKTGEVVWKHPTGEFAYGGPIVVGDAVYYSSHVHFYGFDAATGNVRFELKTPYSQNVGSDGKALFTNEQGLTKRAFDGKWLATAKFSATPMFKPDFVAPFMILGTTTQELVGFSTNTLEEKWKFKGKDGFWDHGVAYEGIYYIGDESGYVYALRLPE